MSRPVLTHKQKVASFQLSYSMCMAAQLKAKEKPKTAIWNRLKQLEEYLGTTLDYYRVMLFRRADLDRAVKLFDRLDVEIASLYPSGARKRQDRRHKRNNQAKGQAPIRTKRR